MRTCAVPAVKTVKELVRRRFRELREKGVETDFDTVLRDIELRDRNDSSRPIAPLRPAEDAVIVDTTEHGLNESFEIIRDIIEVRR